MDVFFYEAFEEEAGELKNYLPAEIKAGFSWKTIQEANHEHPPAPVISVRTQSSIPESWAGELKAVLSRSTGFDHLLKYRNNFQNTSFGYLPLYCPRAVAEQALLLWLSLLRKLPRQMKQFHSFNRDGLTGFEMAGKTLLVVGVGNIGSEICRIGQGLGMKVLGVEIDIKHPEFYYVSIEEGISQADIIVCAMNLTEKNKGYFHADLLSRAKKGALFINVSRGELSPPEELLKVMQKGHLGGIGLDVYDEEQELALPLRSGKKPEHPKALATLELLKYPQVICTPHNAFNTAEAVDRKAQQSIQQIQSFIRTGKFIWTVPF